MQHYCKFLPLNWSKYCYTYTFKVIHILAIVDSGTPLVHIFVPNYVSIPVNFLQELPVTQFVAPKCGHDPYIIIIIIFPSQRYNNKGHVAGNYFVRSVFMWATLPYNINRPTRLTPKALLLMSSQKRKKINPQPPIKMTATIGPDCPTISIREPIMTM